MVPADQRLGAGDGSRFQGDDRLIHHRQLAVDESLAKILLVAQPLGDDQVERRGEDLEPRAAVAFRRIHCDIRLAQHVGGCGAVIAEDHADAGAHEHVAAADVIRLPEGGEDATGAAGDIASVADVVEENGELVAPQA